MDNKWFTEKFLPRLAIVVNIYLIIFIVLVVIDLNK